MQQYNLIAAMPRKPSRYSSLAGRAALTCSGVMAWIGCSIDGAALVTGTGVPKPKIG
jgi:hypothetical protein